jgi:hypothetical protein
MNMAKKVSKSSLNFTFKKKDYKTKSPSIPSREKNQK